MNLVVRRVGNSLGVILPKEMLERYGVQEGTNLQVIDGERQFALRPETAELCEQLKAARLGMAKYRTALRELAK